MSHSSTHNDNNDNLSASAPDLKANETRINENNRIRILNENEERNKNGIRNSVSEKPSHDERIESSQSGNQGDNDMDVYMIMDSDNSREVKDQITHSNEVVEDDQASRGAKDVKQDQGKSNKDDPSSTSDAVSGLASIAIINGNSTTPTSAQTTSTTLSNNKSNEQQKEEKNKRKGIMEYCSFKHLYTSVLASLATGFVLGMYNYSFGLFVPALSAQFPQWSRTEINGAFSTGQVTANVIAPLLGVLIDRYGPRVIVTMSLLFVSSGYAILGYTVSLGYLYAAFAMMGVGYTGATMLGPGKLISGWFPPEKRSFVVGSVMLSNNLFGFVFLQIGYAVEHEYGWRWIAGTFCLSLLTLSILYGIFVRDHSPNYQHDMGMKSDNSNEVNNNKNYNNDDDIKSIIKDVEKGEIKQSRESNLRSIKEEECDLLQNDNLGNNNKINRHQSDSITNVKHEDSNISYLRSSEQSPKGEIAPEDAEIKTEAPQKLHLGSKRSQLSGTESDAILGERNDFQLGSIKESLRRSLRRQDSLDVMDAMDKVQPAPTTSYEKAKQEKEIEQRKSENPYFDITLAEAAKTRIFYTTSLGIVLCYFTYSGMLSQILPALVADGYSVSDAKNVVSAVGLVGVPTKVLSGKMAEKLTGRLSLIICVWIEIFGILLYIVNSNNTAAVWAGTIIYGLGFGAVGALLPIVVLETFGSKSFGQIFGTINLVYIIPSLCAPLMTGRSYDQTGSYHGAFYGMCAIFALGTFLLAIDVNFGKCLKRKIPNKA